MIELKDFKNKYYYSGVSTVDGTEEFHIYIIKILQSTTNHVLPALYLCYKPIMTGTLPFSPAGCREIKGKSITGKPYLINCMLYTAQIRLM